MRFRISQRCREPLDHKLPVAYGKGVGKTTRTRDTLYLDADKFALLEQLAKNTRIPRAELSREAIDDLLVKYKLLKAPKRKP